MRNIDPEACSVCQGTVPAGGGTLRREASGWSLTHNEACPREMQDNGSIRHGYALAYMRRVMVLLRRKDATLDEIEESVKGLGALVRTRWTDMEACERILLKSPALADKDRFLVEEILGQLLLEESHA